MAPFGYRYPYDICKVFLTICDAIYSEGKGFNSEDNEIVFQFFKNIFKTDEGYRDLLKFHDMIRGDDYDSEIIAIEKVLFDEKYKIASGKINLPSNTEIAKIVEQRIRPPHLRGHTSYLFDSLVDKVKNHRKFLGV